MSGKSDKSKNGFVSISIESRNFQRNIKDFFDFIVWESISSMLIELPGDTDKNNLIKFRAKLKNAFLESLKESKYMLKKYDYKTHLKSICDELEFVNEPMSEYIFETMSIFRDQLLKLLKADGSPDNSKEHLKYQDLEHLIEEYVLISYLDKFTLSNVMKTILYSAKISFAEVFEFRVHIIELFRDALESRTSLKDIQDYLESELDRFSLNLTVKSFILSRIYGFIIFIYKNRNFSKMIKIMKKSIKNKITISSDLTFIENEKLNGILKWLINEVINPFIEVISSKKIELTPDLSQLKSFIEEIFKKQLQRKVSVSSAIGEIHQLHKIIKIGNSDRRNKKNILKVDSSIYTSHVFIDHGLKHMIKRVPLKKDGENNDTEKIIELFFDMLENLASIIDDELSIDFKLDKLYKIISETENITDQIYL